MWQRTAIQHVGKTFGRLKVVRVVYRLGKKAYESHFVCKCACGKTKEVYAARVLRGLTRSCGCLRVAKRNFESKEYRAWSALKQRCFNPNNPSFVKYGARGVTVAKVWLGKKGFDRFLSDVGVAPSPDYSLDRKSAHGNYTPSNVRWATAAQQAINKRNFVPSKRPRVVYTLKEKARSAWKNARHRCHNENDPAFHYYGGRGIAMCSRWRGSFFDFLNDMGLPPSRHHTLDRRNPNKGYSPTNCRWATRKEQGDTRRSTTLISYRGYTHSITEWARRIGMNHQTLRYRLLVKKESFRSIIQKAS